MVWTETTRAKYERHSGRYASDLTDHKWGDYLNIATHSADQSDWSSAQN